MRGKPCYGRRMSPPLGGQGGDDEWTMNRHKMNVKNLIISIILLFCISFPLWAQSGEVHFSPSGGIFAEAFPVTMTCDNPGLTIRYTCEKYLAAICALQAEVNYTNLGWKEVIEPQYGTDTYNRDIHYLQVPLLARLGWGRELRGLQGYLILGPQVAFCIGSKEHYSDPWAGTPRPNNVTQQYGRDVENFFEYGITAGLGMEVSTRHAGHFLIEGRYYYGLADIFYNSKRDPFGRSANGAIIIKATYLFDLLRTKGVQRK